MSTRHTLHFYVIYPVTSPCSHLMMIYSNLHEHFIAKSLCDGLVIDHIRVQMLPPIENHMLWRVTVNRVLYDLLVPVLQVLLETVLIIHEQKHVENPEQGEVATDFGQTVNHSCWCNCRLLKRVIVVSVFKENAELLVLFKVREALYEVGLIKGKVNVALSLTPRPKIL